MGDDIIDLRDPSVPPVEEVIAWLRSPGGVLGDRLMRSYAADMLERAHAEGLVAIPSGE